MKRRIEVVIAVLGLGLLASPGVSRAGGEGVSAYRVIHATEYGRVVSAHMQGATSVQVALRKAVADIAQYFGTQPTVSSAYQDAKDPRSGGARFTVNAGGKQLVGAILCRLGDGGANVAVAFAYANTPPEAWRRLTTAPASTPAARPHDSAAAAPSLAALREYRFPDGTGSIGLAPGWRTSSQSEAGGIVVTGPNDQLMLLGIPATVVVPNSQTARNQAGFRGGPQMLVAPFGTPMETFVSLVPQLSRASMQNGGSGFSVDHPRFVDDFPAHQKGGRASRFRVFVTERGRRYEALIQIELTPIPPETFTMFQTCYRAPEGTLDRDLPLMSQMASSVQENGKVIWAKANQEMAARKQQAEEFQRVQAEKSDAFFNDLHAHQRASRDDSRAREDGRRATNESLRSADDTDEYIRGVRTVEDTRTGDQVSVNLGDVDTIVEGLNDRDPGRYRQIPLRDEAHPR